MGLPDSRQGSYPSNQYKINFWSIGHCFYSLNQDHSQKTVFRCLKDYLINFSPIKKIIVHFSACFAYLLKAKLPPTFFFTIKTSLTAKNLSLMKLNAFHLQHQHSGQINQNFPTMFLLWKRLVLS